MPADRRSLCAPIIPLEDDIREHRAHQQSLNLSNLVWAATHSDLATPQHEATVRYARAVLASHEFLDRLSRFLSESTRAEQLVASAEWHEEYMKVLIEEVASRRAYKNAGL